jgi:putative hydrolase of the HAD superfamily
MFSAIGFDHDFTLYDQADFVMPFFRHISPALADASKRTPGVVYRTLAKLWRQRTPHYGHLFDDVLRTLDIYDPCTVQRLVKEQRAWRPSLNLYPGVEPVLKRLRSMLPLFLITDGNSIVQRYKVGVLGVTDVFTAAIFTDEFGPGWQKPSRSPFLRATELLSVRAEDCLYVGDNPDTDIEGAHRCGMKSIRVLTGPYRNCLKKTQLQHVVGCANEIEHILEF